LIIEKEPAMKTLLAISTAAAAALVLTGCPASMSGAAYSRDQARQVQTVQMGTVESVRDVMIEGTKTPIGPAAGAAVGGIAGSTVGGGRGSTVGAIVGAVAGGVAGAAIEEGATREKGLEITVKLDNGRLIAVTQAADEAFRPGERVRVLTGGGVTRITH
jgi:outer membrane lipoprotein SlyB